MTASRPGFFGKFFNLGDFVGRRLPRDFLEAWDAWLQGGMAASREQLGAGWLKAYLHSPIWRFGLSPGICGTSAWAGVLMPSVDKVGRHFPLTLASPIADADDLPHLFAAKAGVVWFAELEKLALSALEDDFDLDAFDRRLQSLSTPGFSDVSSVFVSGSKKFAHRIEMQSLSQLPDAFLDASGALMQRYMPTYSLWCSGCEQSSASLMLVEGLLPIDSYSTLLTGRQSGLAPLAVAVQVSDDSDTLPVGRLHWRSFGSSVVGQKRRINEDALLERACDGLWAVADGMGGHHAGDFASQSVVKALEGLAAPADIDLFAARVDQALSGVNQALISKASEGGDAGRVIGSTVVVLLAKANRCIFLWAGDSRLYRFRKGRLEQLSRDHSLLEDFVRKGLMSAEQMKGSGRSEIITRAVGASELLALERGECDARVGDLFLLCSDGLDKELNQEEMEALFLKTAFEDIVAMLIQKAEEKGARDNVTAVVAGLFT